MLFTPILKTKQSSEYHAIEAAKEIFKAKPFVRPYIECIKEIDERGVQKYIELLDDCFYFLEPSQSDIPSVLSNINSYPANCTVVLRINDNTAPADVESFIFANKINNRRCALKINNSDDRYVRYIKRLTNDDYLFVELGGTAYSSSSFLDDLLSENLDCKIIIHSNERDQYLRGEDFANYAFNKKANFNFSIIDAIKAKTFAFDGFGSRCTTKDDNTEDVKKATPIYGVFLIYDYNNNNIFSVKSSYKDYIARIYYDVRNLVNKNMVSLDLMFFSHSPITKKILDFYMGLEKTSCNKFITISIVRYIEEIANNLV